LTQPRLGLDLRLTIKEEENMRNRRRLKNRHVNAPLNLAAGSAASRKCRAPYGPPARWIIDEDDQLITRLGLKRL